MRFVHSMPRLAVVLAAAAAFSAAAQDGARQGAPLKTSEVTEAAIVDALAPAAVEPAASGPRSRGIAPALRPQAKKPGSTSVLITFMTDSAQLTTDSRNALDTIARALRNGKLANLSFQIQGHADPRGDADHNMDLSRERAESVVSYLVKEHGIDRARLQPVGKGSTELLNKAQPDAPENRRVTIVTQPN
ncbi:MAG: OmpA family protein [Rubrivivax sp.]